MRIKKKSKVFLFTFASVILFFGFVVNIHALTFEDISEQLQDIKERIIALEQVVQQIFLLRNENTASILGEDVFLGTESEAVRVLQKTLQKQKIYDGPVTGYFGELTQQAVTAFQKKYGIEPTGSVGPLTRSQLNILSQDPDDIKLSDPQASHTCAINPFSGTVKIGEIVSYSIMLTPSSPGSEFQLSLGALPEGISSSFSQKTGTTTRDVKLIISVKDSVSPGSLSLLVIYQETGIHGSTLSNFCQLNLVIE